MRSTTLITTSLLVLAVGVTGCDALVDGRTAVHPDRPSAGPQAAAVDPGATTSTTTGTTVVITPSDPRWSFSSDHYNEDGDLVTGTAGTGGIVTVPEAGPWGAYGFELTVPASQKARAMTDLYNGRPLAALTEVVYSTYIASAWLSGYGPSINVMIDPEGPDDFVTLVWEANKAGLSIVEDTWQTWNTTGGDGGWWSPSIQPFGSSTPGSNANPAQLSALVAHFGADSEIIGFAVNVGRHGAMTSYVDGVGITADGATTTYDFEAFATAGSKDDCKLGGWENVRRADGSGFKNQGACNKYVNTGT